MHMQDTNNEEENVKNTNTEENLRDDTDLLIPCNQEVLDETSGHRILPFDDLVREVLAQKAEAIRVLCGDITICWLEIGRKLNESWAIFEAEKASLSEYQKWVRVEFRFGDTTESKHRRVAKYLDENPDKLADVPKPYLIEAGWNKLQMTLTMEENRELGKKGFLKSSRFTKGGIFLRFTHLSTEFELTALTSRQLERLMAGKHPDGKKSDFNQPGGSGKSPKHAIEKSEAPGSNPSPESGEPSESQAECERLRIEIHALKVDLERRTSEVDKMKVEMERKDSRINELEKLLRQQQGHLNADATSTSGPESVDDPESETPKGDEHPNLLVPVEEPAEQDYDNVDVPLELGVNPPRLDSDEDREKMADTSDMSVKFVANCPGASEFVLAEDTEGAVAEATAMTGQDIDEVLSTAWNSDTPSENIESGDDSAKIDEIPMGHGVEPDEGDPVVPWRRPIARRAKSLAEAEACMKMGSLVSASA